jgi:hypothetical protein
LVEVPADERGALFAELCANDYGEPDAEGASKLTRLARRLSQMRSMRWRRR